MDRDELRREKEATQFAMALLMPSDLVADEVAKIAGAFTIFGDLHLFDDDRVATLARKFQVDVGVMTVRLAELGFFGDRPALEE